MTEHKLRVAVVFGGKSGEHEVSLRSARSIMSAMDPGKYEIYPIGITKQGYWLTSGGALEMLDKLQAAGLETVPALSRVPGGPPEVSPFPVSANRRQLIPGTWDARFPQVDVVFPVLHGTMGEDGTVQGLFELADLAYVGAGVLGSALGLDKAAQKDVLTSHGLPVVGYVVILRREWLAQPDAVMRRVSERLRYPVFVKPANMGSSVGVTKVHTRDELAHALDTAARYDRKLVVEAGIDAREIECSVLGNDAPVASVPGEVVPSGEFYDYRAKYIDGASELDIPARLDADTTQRIRSYATQAFVALDCAGMARADFFVERGTGRVYINELNTIPGFTEISMYPKLWEASGLPYPALIDRLIALAIERRTELRSLETSYDWEKDA